MNQGGGGLLLGAVGAVAGGMFGMPGLGFSVGMMAGSWIFGSPQDNKKKVDPAQASAPRPNSSIRGSTMPILFGTNRVSGNIVWTANFTSQPVKKKSAGKAGGSGGKGGKTGADAGTGSYKYYWDMIYHFGIVSQPMAILGGWLGREMSRTRRRAFVPLKRRATRSPGSGCSCFKASAGINVIP